MFGIGFGELIIIFIVALIVLGPKRLPEFARTVAKIYREVIGTINEFKTTVLDDTVRGMPKNYVPPNLDSGKLNIEEESIDSNIGGIKDGMEEYKNIKIEGYEPKREKISFNKKKKDSKEDVSNVPKDK